MISAVALRPYAQYLLPEAAIPELPSYSRGKVRDNYDLPGGRRVLIASDRISAFDVNLAVVPLKGQALTEIARFWFEETKDICRNHVLDYPDPNVLVGQRLRMMPVEIVVRDYLAGTTSTSTLQMYKKGARHMYGHAFPDGMRDNQKLGDTLITPTTKAGHGDHDAPLSGEDIVSRQLLTREQWDEVSALALELFARGVRLAARNGLILVDTKYEFGFDEGGSIILADEIHTPDSSRYWRADSYAEKFERGEAPETFDKDFIRRWVIERCDPYKDPIPQIPDEMILETAATYLNAYERITGLPFPLPDLATPPLARIRRNMERYFHA